MTSLLISIKIILMKLIKKIFCFIFLLFILHSCSNSSESDPLKVLFIGNSYMYYNSSPELFKALVNEKFPNKVVEVQLISQGGMTLKRHWEEEKAVQAIQSNDWDYVILQEQSKLGMGLIIDNDIYFGQTDYFYEYARKFDVEIANAGAQTAFFMTWSIKQRPEEQEILTHAYCTIAKELDAKLIPIGLVWDKIRTTGEFDLYVNDGSHPSAHGSYLAASTIFSSLLEESPTGLSGTISGLELSSSGEPSLEIQSLVDIPDADALAIQKASWDVVEAIGIAGGYVDMKEPRPSYVLPEFSEGDIINSKDIEGRWYGTSTYSSNYLGLILDIDNIDSNLEIELSFYTPDSQDEFVVKDVELLEKQLNLTIMDSLRTMNSKVSFSLNQDELYGLSKSFGGNIINYKHWNLTKQKTQNNIDLEAVDGLMQSFKSDISERGYVQAAMRHYERYSALINETYLPEENYLNAVGYNFIQDKKVNRALDVFELAMTLYPESVNTYDSYGETLIVAGEYEKGLMIYTKGYELAKKIGHENVSYMEANLKKFKEGKSIQVQLPPAPPPPTQ